MTNEERDKLLQELWAWKQDLDPLRQKWDLYWSRWELEGPSDAENPYISKFTAPYPFSHVETILPRIVGNEPSIVYVAADDDEDDMAASMLSAVASWQMEQMRFEWEIRNFLRQGLMLGYSVGKLWWERQTTWETMEVVREKWHEELMVSFQTRANERVEMVKWNQACFETVDIYDFVWPLRATTLDKAPAVWQRCWVTMDRIKQMARDGHYTNIGDIEPWQGSNNARGELARRYASQGVSPNDQRLDDKDAGMVELWERWEDDRLTVIANQEYVIRDEANPFVHSRKPYMDFAPVERPFSMHGVGIIKMLWDMNEDLSALKRQRRDAVTFLIAPMWKGTEGIKESDLRIRPGGLFKVPDTEDIQPMTEPQVDFAASYQEEQNAKQDMQLVTGAFDYLSGINPGGVQTATGVATIAQEGNKRIQEMINIFAERTMKRFGAQLASLCVQYLDNDMAIPIYQYPEAQAAWEQLHGDVAPRIVKMGKEDVKTKGRVLPMPKVGNDKQVSDLQKRSDAVQTIQAVAPLLASPTPIVNMQALAEWVLKQMGMDKHDRAKVMDTSQAQVLPPAGPAPPPGGGGGIAGLLSAAGVVGAPGVSGPSGPSMGASDGASGNGGGY